jgi:crossover junction endodeoxyribonuclease RuvC
MDAVVCGIDPGLGITGYAVVRSGRGVTLIDAGACRLDERKPLHERLVDLDRDITSVLSEHQPALLAVEDLYAHYKHPKTAILMGHARGVILLAAARVGIETRSYPATNIKRLLTGNGHASKPQMQRAVQATLGLAKLPEPADVADAIATALCCALDLSRSVPQVGVA